MIILNKIKKEFDDSTIFTNFSYTFQDTGLYVLWGNSGSGKTTLLNLLIGIEDFQEGNITINNNTFNKKVNFYNVQSDFAYIAQDNYFLDYLTVEENIEILYSNFKQDKNVKNLLKILDLEKKLKSFPNNLSGGEKQRLALLQALVKKKKIILLDEPSASLDNHNKEKLINILNNLKKNVLIICATHDSLFLSIADDHIDFNNKNQYKSESIVSEQSLNENKSLKNGPLRRENNSLRNLIHYMLKKPKQTNSEKKSTILLVIVFTITFLLSFACSNFEEKLLDGIILNYDVNGIKVSCNNNTNECLKTIEDSNYSIKFRSYIDDSYYLLPHDIVDGGYRDSFELGLLTIPFDHDNFLLAKKRMLYGSYFTKQDQLILGYEEAIRISNKTNTPLTELIGKKYTLNLPKGNYDFTICGIFPPFDIKTIYYLRGVFGENMSFDNYMYISNTFYQEYYNKNLKSDVKSHTYFLYFNDNYDLINFYKQYKNSNKIILNDFTKGFIDYESYLTIFSYYASPIIVAMIIFTMLFFYQTKKIEMAYNENEILIYQYYGFSSKKIKYAMLASDLLVLLKKIAFSFILSTVVSLTLNVLFIKLKILPFKLFKFNLEIFISLLFLLILTSLFFSLRLFNHFNKDGWFKILKGRRDLL